MKTEALLKRLTRILDELDETGDSYFIAHRENDEEEITAISNMEEDEAVLLTEIITEKFPK